MATRTFTESKLIIASHNAGKVREITELLEPFLVSGGVEITGAAHMNLTEPEETGDSFVENAIIKARAAAQACGCPALSDDSGLCVDNLGGAPGIFSARWAGPDKNFADAMQKIMEATADFETSKAHFACALALCWADGHTESFTGYVHGQLIWPPRGDRGFGYDPMFVPEGHHQTFGEMTPAEKTAISHRSDAFRKLVDGCFRPS